MISTQTTEQIEIPKERIELAKAELTKAETKFQKQLTENVGISTGVGIIYVKNVFITFNIIFTLLFKTILIFWNLKKLNIFYYIIIVAQL